MKKYLILLSTIILISTFLLAEPISIKQANQVANNFLQQKSKLSTYQIIEKEEIESSKSQIVSYLFQLAPKGFIIVSPDSDIEPIIAYSFRSNFDADRENLLPKMIKEDLSNRLLALDMISESKVESNNQKWNKLAKAQNNIPPSKNFQQWPAEGSTSTGGWLTTTWDQGYHYNMFCPLDPNTGQRCVVGCVATAMSMIINYHEYAGDVSFSSPQDSYVTNGIEIDSDSLEYDFPGFNQLNTYLDTMKVHYADDIPLTDEDEAALCFACGISVYMGYSSSGSGAWTQEVADALVNKFGYESAEWMESSVSSFYDTLSYNMITARPAEISIRLSDWTGGHAINVDGYNTDDFYHLNFGWGATSPDPIADAWYDLPQGMPAGYCIITGGVVNIEGGVSPLQVGGMVNAGDVNPEGAKITFSGEYGYSTTVQDSLGNYQLPAVYPGTYTASAILDRVWFQEKEVVIDSLHTSVNFDLFNYESVNGIVQLEDNYDPVGTEIYFIGENNTYSTVVDDVDGDYEVPDVLPGEYTAIASKQRMFYQKKDVIIDSLNMSVNFYLENFYNDSVIKYHNDEAENLIDVMSEQTVGVAARFTPDELAAKVGDIIGGIEFYAPTSSDSCSVTLKIWQGGSIDDPPGELVFEKEVDDFEGNTWVGDYLHAPIEILADTEYWIGYIIHTTNGKACWLDSSEIVENKGLWLKPSDAWIYPGANPDLANNLMIQMTTYSDYAIDAPAVPVESFVSSSSSPNPFTENTKISFSLKPENNITNLDVMIFNIKGQLIKSLPADINQNSGSVIWDGTNKENNFMPSGVYLYRLWNRSEAKFLKPNGKILLIK